MLWRVIRTALELDIAAIHVVIGHGGEVVRDHMTSLCSTVPIPIVWVVQPEQKGTGHAVAQAMPRIHPQSRCLVLYGDVPLVDPEDLRKLSQSESELAILTSTASDSTGLGRILRSESGDIKGIVEHQDANAGQRSITEVNTGILCCEASLLGRWLQALDCDNEQGEYYLTDVVGMAAAEGVRIHGRVAREPDLLVGVNSRTELAAAERIVQRQSARELMEAGVTLMDPARLDIRGEVCFGRDCIVDVNVVLEGRVEVGSGVTIGPGCVIRDARIGDGCHIYPYTIVENAVMGARCMVGPFARLRPKAKLADDVRVGNFVEIKKSELADGVKVNHLSYVGDTQVGRNSNLGAGVITCNYDGFNKLATVIGEEVFVGSDSQLVAPVRIADGVTIGAGTTVTKNVEDPGLVVSRTSQKFYRNWERSSRKRP